MIPALIHSGYFGTFKETALNRECFESWYRVMPDHAGMWWDRHGGPRDFGSPINNHNYLKYWALYEFGGWFLDNDVQILKPFDRTPNVAIGFQRDDTDKDCINTAVLGAIPGHPFIRECLDRLDASNGVFCPIWAGCGLPTAILREMGMKGLNIEQMVGDIKVHSKDAFYPWRWDENPNSVRMTEKTVCIHHWEGSWK